jgi:hypothetical protein
VELGGFSPCLRNIALFYSAAHKKSRRTNKVRADY